MPISNKQIAGYLLEYADSLEAYADNPYRIRAYRRAARTLTRLEKEIVELVDENFDLTELPTIGSAIAHTIHEIIKTNQAPQVKRKKQKEKIFRQELQVGKTGKKYEKFFKYKTADLIIQYVRNRLLAFSSIVEAIPTSQYRRKSELVGNVDWIVVTDDVQKAFKIITELDIVKDLVTHSEKSISVILHSSLFMTFHFEKDKLSGASLLFYTGSSNHIETLNHHAKKIGSDIYFHHSTLDRLTCLGTEAEIYHTLGLAYIEPELRENRGEIAAAEKNNLPVLVSLSDIKGDLHSHTNETDGVETLEVMVEAAAELGYEYFAITDHSKRLAITNGLDERRLLKQIELINHLNIKYPGIQILKSIEVDILEDGSLDLSDEVLKELDIRVCSIHSKFKLPEDKQTERIIRAMDNPYFNIMGHMTGRLLTSRKPYNLQIEKIFMAAKERGCFIELNAQPSRLDINDSYCKLAKEMGIKLAVSSDAHSVRELSFLQYGINQARRGWLEKEDVINTRSLAELMKLIKRN